MHARCVLDTRAINVVWYSLRLKQSPAEAPQTPELPIYAEPLSPYRA